MKPYFNKGVTAISKLQMQFTSFLKVFKTIENLEIWVWSNFIGIYILSLLSSHYWCHWCKYAPTPNESTKILNILFKNLWMVSLLNCNRKIETFWNSLFCDKSIWYRCIQNVVTKFTGAINVKQTYLTIQLPVWIPESSLIMNISGYFHPWC